jgi:hypothetical protein
LNLTLAAVKRRYWRLVRSTPNVTLKVLDWPREVERQTRELNRLTRVWKRR